MINRLRAGETNIWDLINVNNPWARKVMFPEGLIKPIDRARFEPYFAKMLPGFKPPYKWAMDDSGEHLLGIAQRFGPYSFVVNTDKISRETAEDQAGNCGTTPRTTRNTASRHPTTGTSSICAASPASTRTASTLTKKSRNTPRPPTACSKARGWSAISLP